MKVFISVPMSNRTIEQIEEDIENAKKDFPFNGRRTHFIDNFMIDEMSTKLGSLARAINLIDGCDAIYMCPNWEEHPECVIEFMVAMMYDTPIYGCVHHVYDNFWQIVSTENPINKKGRTVLNAGSRNEGILIA